MKYRAIIFDMDGTIVDTENIWFDATKKVIENRGILYTQELHDTLSPRLHGLASYECCCIIKDELRLLEAPEEILAEKRLVAQQLFGKGVRFIDGFHDFHKQAITLNLRCAVATNADDETVRLTNESLNLKNYFGDHIYGISCVGNVCKPNPAIYTHAANMISVDPRECIAIEDSEHGILAAKQAGMYCIGINTARCRDRLSAADEIVDMYQDLSLEQLLKKI